MAQPLLPYKGRTVTEIFQPRSMEYHMEEIDIKHQFHLLQKEVEAAVSLLEDTKLNLLSTIDALKIEIEVLRRFLGHHYADFTRRYPKLREEVVRQLDPEWEEPGEKKQAHQEK